MFLSAFVPHYIYCPTDSADRPSFKSEPGRPSFKCEYDRHSFRAIPSDASSSSAGLSTGPDVRVEELLENIMSADFDRLCHILEGLQCMNSAWSLITPAFWQRTAAAEQKIIMSPQVLCRLAEVYAIERAKFMVNLDSLEKFLGLAVDVIGAPRYSQVRRFMEIAEQAGVEDSFEALMGLLVFHAIDSRSAESWARMREETSKARFSLVDQDLVLHRDDLDSLLLEEEDFLDRVHPLMERVESDLREIEPFRRQVIGALLSREGSDMEWGAMSPETEGKLRHFIQRMTKCVRDIGRTEVVGMSDQPFRVYSLGLFLHDLFKHANAMIHEEVSGSENEVYDSRLYGHRRRQPSPAVPTDPSGEDSEDATPRELRIIP